MIYFLCPDYEEPSGGLRKLYRQVDILTAAGIPTTILHHKAPFRCSWFEHTTPIAYLKETAVTPEDLAVIPEIFGRRIARMFPGVPKIIFNQNAYNTFDSFGLDDSEAPYPYTEVRAALVVSENNAAYLRYAFPDLPLYRIIYGIDPVLFRYEGRKLNQACLMPRKNEQDARQVIHMLRARRVALPIRLIEGLNERETAKVLRESRFFLSFGHPEGFGLPAAEAMACGCVAVGYHGMGGCEFFKAPYAYPVDFGDILCFAQTIEQVIPQDLTPVAEAAAAFIHEQYSPEREQQSILDAWQAILTG